MLILYISGGTYSLKSTFHGNFYLLSDFLPEIWWEEIPNEILFVFWFDGWPGGSNPGFSSNKSTHYLLEHSDFTQELKFKSVKAWIDEKQSRYNYLVRSEGNTNSSEVFSTWKNDYLWSLLLITRLFRQNYQEIRIKIGQHISYKFISSDFKVLVYSLRNLFCTGRLCPTFGSR